VTEVTHGAAERARARQRWILITAALVLVPIAAGYVVFAAHRTSAGRASAVGTLRLDAHGLILFRDAAPNSPIAEVPLARPGAARTIGRLSCVRVYTAAGTGVCLSVRVAAVPSVYAVVLGPGLRELRRVKLPGAPSRARVSASGRMISWTVFVSGDSYTSPNLSTRTGVLDLRTGNVVMSLEDFALYKDGRRYTAPDVNYWGVTFTADDDHFYATVRTKGKTYLVEGDVAARTMRTLRENVECPSLSPDGTRLVFKKATGVPGRPWRLDVLDLRTMRETPLAETRSVDDQAAWLDDHTVMYGMLDGGTPDVWAVPADGGGTPRLLIHRAYSPSVLR
jgi:hypothetical protein